jgi:hypothetical protein
MHTRRAGRVVRFACSVAVVASTLQVASAGQTPAAQTPPPAEAKPPAAAPQLSPADQQDLVALTQLVDAVGSGQQPASPPDVKVGWVSNHFIRSQGDVVYVPFTVTVDRTPLTAPSIAIYVRAVSKTASAPPAPGARPTYPWDKIHAVDLPADGRLSRAIALPPGAYDLYICIKQRGAPVPGKIGVLKHELTVPSLGGADPTTSSVILARAYEQLPAPLSADKQEENPYVFGTLKLTPSLDGVFPKSGNLHVMFWIYGAAQTNGKPDVLVEFSFSQKQPDGTYKYFNKTKPQAMNAESLPPEFNLTAGHQLLSSLSIPLASFPVGDYRLEIKITDKPSTKSVTREADFQVSA